MGKALIGLGARVVVEYTLSLFAGLECFYGWYLGEPTAWLAPYAAVPLYWALALFSAGMFLLGSVHLTTACGEGLDRLAQYRRGAADARRDALVKAVESMIDLHDPQTYMNELERLSFLELHHDDLKRFDLAASAAMSDEHTVMYYRRLLPYLRLGVTQAQEAARSWRERHDGDAGSD